MTQQGQEVYFQSGSVPTLRTRSGTEPLLRTVLETPQIQVAFDEIAPDDLREQLLLEGNLRWTFPSLHGRVTVKFGRRGDRISASIRPAGEDEELQSDSPAANTDTSAAPAEEVAGSEQAAATAASSGLVLVPPPSAPVDLRAILVGDPAEGMNRLLELTLQRRASDLHLSSETPPVLRVDGEMRSDDIWPPVPAERLQEMLWTITPDKQRAQFEADHDADFAHETEAGRFRVNLFMDRKGMGAVLRTIPTTILTSEQLGLSKAILDLCSLQKGLVLVTGPTGSGKSTTLAAMIDHINRTRDDHIITIEDPIEFQHSNHRCLVNQREVGAHTKSFKQALRAALREDPDVVLVGELRDLETIATAIETAETGHLVFGTLHTNTAPSTVDRIIDQFPPDQQSQVRTMLSESLKGVVTQVLCKRIGGGRVAAHEILLVNGAVSNVIREGKTFQLPSLMQTGRAAGNCTFNDSLLDLVKKGLVEPQEAIKKSTARAELRSALERLGIKLEGGAGEGAQAAAAVG